MQETFLQHVDNFENEKMKMKIFFSLKKILQKIMRAESFR